MKRIYNNIVILVLIVISINTFAISNIDNAINTASSFVADNNKSNHEIILSDVFHIGNEKISGAVIIKMSPQGFIAVSNDGLSILAYSFSNNIPDNQSDFWSIWENMILGLNSNYINSVHTKKAIIRNNKSFEIGPFVYSLWGQVNCKDNYGNTVNVTNIFTPNNYAVGCVAVSMSTLMQHYDWPVNGSGSHTYSDNYGSSRGTYSADFENTDYPWNDMLNRYNNKTSTQIEREAAGLLNFHSAIALEMDFEYNGSTSNVNRIPNAGKNYFRYSSLNRYPSSSVFWPLLDSNMMHQTPVVLAIAGNGYGHSVVCDGIRIEEDSTFYYHLNMGWWGSANGWYRLKEDWNAGGYSQITGGVFNFLPIPSLETPYFDENIDSVVVRWDYPETPNFNAFELQTSGDGSSWETIVDTLTQKYFAVFVDSEKENKFRVKAQNNGLWASDSWSTTVTAIWDNTGIFETYKTLEISISPNPVIDFITVNTPSKIKNYQIQIFEINGKEVFNITIFNEQNNHKIDISKLK